MCLGIPGQIQEFSDVHEHLARVDVSGVTRVINIGLLEDEGLSAYRELGVEIIGAYENALINDRECFVLWAIPEWSVWADFERAWSSHGALGAFKAASDTGVDRFERRLLTDNPLNPLVIGRQPHEDDQRPMSEF